MADTHSIQSALNHALISANRQLEKSSQILALLTGTIALLDPEQHMTELTLLEMASDEAGDLGNLNEVTRTLESLLARTAED